MITPASAVSSNVRNSIQLPSYPVQDPVSTLPTLSPYSKTALVLSSGGLFGAYQVGVWKYLAESGFRPDLVVGASVGALNGWAIAGGCRPEDLVDQWLDEARSNVLKPLQKTGLRAGFFDREPLRNLTLRLFEDYRPTKGFGLVTVELPFLRTRLFSGSAITAQHLLASSSIPIAMPAVSIGGKTFTDGGLLEDVPLWAAVKMGATHIVAVDAMHFDCPWWYRAGVSPMSLFAPRVQASVRAKATIIRPLRPLGDYQEALTWNRARILNWLERGYTDARVAVSSGSEAVSNFPAVSL